MAPRSVTAEVGIPPTQKYASSFLSLIASDDLPGSSRSRRMSFAGSSPSASSTRNAISSVALFGAPVETRLPLRSANLTMPVPSTVTTCMRFG